MAQCDRVLLVSMLATGMLLGALYYGGLWLTIKAAKKSRSPLALFGGSFCIRAVLTAAVLYMVARSGVASMAIALAGLILTRAVLIRWIRRSAVE